MDNFFVRSWWVPALRGIFGIVFAVLALMWPGLTLLSLSVLFAVWALASGIVAVTGAMRHRRTEDDWWFPLLLGLVSIGAGIVAIVNPALTALVLVLVMGANALVSGVLDIVSAIRLRKAIRGEWLMILSGLASIVFGAIVFLFPIAGAFALVWLISLYAFVSGVLLLAAAFRARSIARISAPHGERRHVPDRRMAGAH